MSVAIKENRSALIDGLFPAPSGSRFVAAAIEIRPTGGADELQPES